MLPADTAAATVRAARNDGVDFVRSRPDDGVDFVRSSATVRLARAQLSLADQYKEWEVAAREGGYLDAQNERLDICARRGKYAGLDEGPPRDSFTLVQDAGGTTYSISYASSDSQAQHAELVENANVVDFEPDGREAERAAKRFKKNAAAQQ